MSGDDYIKGGAGIQLRYPLADARTTVDMDTAFADSADAFIQRLSSRLREGWEGFAGKIISKEHGEWTLMPQGSAMTPMKVVILYKGKPFCTFDLEAVPDLPGCAPEAERRLDDGTRSMLEDLGFGNVRKPLVMDATMQLADKLHAISRPGKRRGRDLVDIALLMEHEHIGYDELRKAARRIERSQLQHDIHMLDENEKESYRPTFERTNTERDFDECWNAVQGILRQVDVDHKDEWTKRPPFDCAAA